MGTGDKKDAFHPYHKAVYDNVMRFSFAECAMRPCPHPNVQKKYGVSGECNVSVYVCNKCSFAEHFPLHAGIRCVYGEDQ